VPACLACTCAEVLAYNDNVKVPDNIQSKDAIDTVLGEYEAHHCLRPGRITVWENFCMCFGSALGRAASSHD
jgi:hypothetical protein